MILENKSAKRVTKKNLIGSTKNFLNSAQNTYTVPLNTFYLVGFNPTVTDYVTVKGDYELELNATANNRDIRMIVSAKPNTFYKPSCDTNADVHLFYLDANRTVITQSYNTISGGLTGKTPSNCMYIAFALTNRGLGTGTYYFRNWQLEEVTVSNASATPFEQYLEVNKTFTGTPKKNLIPDWNSSRWFEDSTVAGGKVTVDTDNPYKMTLKLDQPAQARLVHIPVELGKAYTFSFGNITGLYRLYKRKQTAHGGTVLVQDSTPKPFTFVVDAEYGGWVTLRVTQGVTGTFSFENLQLEEGWYPTSFDPYMELNNSASLTPKRNMLNPQAWVSGRIFDTAFKSQNGYRLNGDNLIIMSDINGMVSQVVDVEPNTIYTVFHDSDNDGSRGIYVYSTSGVDLTPSVKISPNVFNSGSNTKVIIGMYKSTSANNLPEIEIVKPMMVKASVKVPFEPFKFVNKADTLVPKTNICPPLKYWSRTDGNAVILSDYEGEINPVSNYTGFKYSSSLGLKRDTLYTLSIDEITPGATCFLAYLDSGGTNRYTTVNSDSLVRTFSIPSSAQYYWMEMHFQTNRGKARFKNFMLQEGTIQRPFEPLEMVKEEKEILRKAVYRNYSFNYKRESVEVLDGLQYSINNPRIKNNGLLIEEGITNTVSNSDQVSRLRVVNNAYGQVTYNHSLPKKLVAQSGSDTYSLQFEAKTLGPASIPFRSIVVGAQPPKDSWSWRIYSSDFSSNEIEDLGNGWSRYKKIFVINGSKGEYLQSFVKFICEVYDTDIDTLIRNVQIEERISPSSYTTGYRKNEIVTIPNTTGFIDSTKGSIYSKFSYLDLKYTMAISAFLFDTTSSTRWFCNYDSILGKFQVVVNGLSLIQFSKETLIEQDNELLIEWNGSNMSVTLNGVVQSASAGSSSARPDLGMLTLGCRFTRDIGWLNGIIKEFVIKDRNGNPTYKI
ncbi:hypothetical protein ACFU1R_06145 [Priestia megaterium]|uniref:hypothetical protein n=1 Tax=Priestia megaterium TaxID=1404 RepID=UPI00366BF1F7